MKECDKVVNKIYDEEQINKINSYLDELQDSIIKYSNIKKQKKGLNQNFTIEKKWNKVGYRLYEISSDMIDYDFELSTIENYLNGMFILACSISKRIGLSYARVVVLNKNNWLQEFCQNYQLDNKKIVFSRRKRKFANILNAYFGNKDTLTKALIGKIRDLLGNEKNVYYSENGYLIDALGGSKGLSGFYFVEDVFFIEYEEVMVILMIGNNE